MGGHTIAEGGLMGEELEEAAGLKLAAGLAMAESLGSCSGALMDLLRPCSGPFLEKLSGESCLFARREYR